MASITIDPETFYDRYASELRKELVREFKPGDHLWANFRGKRLLLGKIIRADRGVVIEQVPGLYPEEAKFLEDITRVAAEVLL